MLLKANNINKNKKHLRILQVSTLQGKDYFVMKNFKMLLGVMVSSEL